MVITLFIQQSIQLLPVLPVKSMQMVGTGHDIYVLKSGIFHVQNERTNKKKIPARFEV